MAKVVVLLTYDLATPPGMQGRFKEEMQKQNWQFKDQGKDLPRTTCYATFVEGTTKEGAKAWTKDCLKKVGELLQKENKEAKPFKIERYLILAMDADHFNAAIKDIG